MQVLEPRSRKTPAGSAAANLSSSVTSVSPSPGADRGRGGSTPFAGAALYRLSLPGGRLRGRAGDGAQQGNEGGPVLGTGFPRADVENDFLRARRRQFLAGLAHRLRGRPVDSDRLVPLDDVVGSLGWRG